MTKNRRPMQVAPEFEARVKKIQEGIMRSQGKNVSIREITENIAKIPDLNANLEKALMGIGSIDIRINLDKRGMRK
jgi:hypothetical protein